VDTGLRWSELGSLRRSSFDFDSDPATVYIQARYAKNRKDDWLPLRPDLVADLRRHMALFLPEAWAFNMPKTRGAEMLRVDLEAAGIPYDNELGRSDFHSLRHTFASLLNASNVPMLTAQKLLRHSDPKLTANIYTHVLVEAKADALSRLPKIAAAPERAAAAKTGTTDSAEGIAGAGQSGNTKKPSRKIDWKIDWSRANVNRETRTCADAANTREPARGAMPENEKPSVPQGVSEGNHNRHPPGDSTPCSQTRNLDTEIATRTTTDSCTETGKGSTDKSTGTENPRGGPLRTTGDKAGSFEIAAVISAWPFVPEQIRTAVLAVLGPWLG
jgi:hypothetical protein